MTILRAKIQQTYSNKTFTAEGEIDSNKVSDIEQLVTDIKFLLSELKKGM